MNKSKSPIMPQPLDTLHLSKELEILLNMQYPFARGLRLQSINSLRSFAIEWSIKFQEFVPEDYQKSVVQFETIKGQIIHTVKKDLMRLQRRDSDNYAKILGGSIDFG